MNDLYVEIDDHRDILNQNPVVARKFNNLPFHVKMLEDKKDSIRNIKEIVTDHQFLIESFICNNVLY